MTLWEDVKRNLIEWYGVTSEKTTEVAKITSRKYDKFGISRDIERQFSELGNVIYTGLREGRPGLLEEPAVQTLMARIGELETELRRKDAEIESIRRQHAERKGGAAAGVETVITDPVLDAGGEDSAILVEPTAEGDEDVNDDSLAGA